MTKEDTITNVINVTFKKNDQVPLLIIENKKTVKNISNIFDYVSIQIDLGSLYLEIEGGDGLVKVDEINYDRLTATVPENSKLNITTVNIFNFVNLSSSCPATSTNLIIPNEEYTSFLRGLPKINYDNNTITLNFLDIRDFIAELPNVGNIGDFAGIYVRVYYLPIGTNVEDLKNVYTPAPEVIGCVYSLTLPSGSPLRGYGGDAVGPASSRQGLLTINVKNVENVGYTGIGGNTRLYITVALRYRDPRTMYAFYVN